MKSITIDDSERVPGTYTYEPLDLMVDGGDLFIILRDGDRMATCFVARPDWVEQIFSDIVYGWAAY